MVGSGCAGAPQGPAPHIDADDRVEAWQVEEGGGGDEGAHCGY